MRSTIQFNCKVYELTKTKKIINIGRFLCLCLFFTSKSFGDFLKKNEYIERINRYDKKKLSEYREAKPAVAHRDALIKRYGEKGSKTLFAEVFGLCEYGGVYFDELIPF